MKAAKFDFLSVGATSKLPHNPPTAETLRCTKSFNPNISKTAIKFKFQEGNEFELDGRIVWTLQNSCSSLFLTLTAVITPW